MPKRITIKDHHTEIQLISQRCYAALAIILTLVILLIIRLAFLQIANNTLYTTLSKKNWLDLVPIEPTRGLIYDRNGVLLAENVPVYSLDIIPNQVTNYPKLLADIAKIIPLSDNDISQFQKQLKQHRRFDEVTLKLRLNEEEVARFAENQYRFKGAIIKARLLRHYPFTNSLSHVLGYVGRINTDELDDIDPANYSATNYIGKLGIEKFYEDELHGTVGYQQAENDASGEAVRILNQIQPIPGRNLYLTLDSKLQSVVEQALSGHRGAVVAIQPATGQILALVSEPSYDPNLFVAGISSQDYQSLQQSPDRPLYNRALRGLYPPASTIKPYMALEGLATGVTDPNDTIYDNGTFQLPNSSHVFHDWKRRGHGVVNVTKAIVSSCDIFFFELAHKLGIQRIDDILNEIGYGALSGIDIDEELAGVVASPAWKKKVKGVTWYPGDTVISGIGQGFMQVTPIQLAAAVATLANRGVRYTPHLLLAEQLPGKPLEVQPSDTLPPVPIHNPAVWNIVINAMQGVITSPEGTGAAHFGKPPVYTVAAKTGTAQVYSIKNYNMKIDRIDQSKLPERLRDNSLFIAFAPADKPQIALAVVVENNSEAAGIARKILDYYFLGIPPVQPATDAAPVAQPTPDATEPDSEDSEENDMYEN